MKRRYAIYLSLISYFFVIAFFQYPGYATGAWILGFSFGFLFGFAGGAILMWRVLEYFMKEYGLHPYYKGWRAELFYWGPKIGKIAAFLIATGIAFFLIISIFQASAYFGGNVIIPVYFGFAVLLLNLAMGLVKDSPDYSAQFDEIIFQLNKIRKLTRRSRRRAAL